MSRGSERALIAAVAIGAVGLVIAVAALAGVFSSDDGDDPQVDSGFGSIDAPEPDSGPPPPRVRRYEIAGRPDTISAGAGYVWAADSLDGTLQRINPDSKRPIAVDVAGFPTDVSAGEGGAWLALADRGAIQRVSGNEGPGPPVDVAGFPFQIAVGEGAVWAMSQSSVERVDPSAQEADDPIDLDGELSAIAAGEGGVWVVRSNSEVLKLDPGSGERSEAVEVPGAFNVTTGESAVWALGASAGGGSGGTLTRIDPAGGIAGSPIAVTDAVDVAAGLGYVWIVDTDGELTRYDPGEGAPVGKPIEVGTEPQSLSVGEGSVWVAAAGSGAVFRITPR